jgi:hypothetical protein
LKKKLIFFGVLPHFIKLHKSGICEILFNVFTSNVLIARLSSRQRRLRLTYSFAKWWVYPRLKKSSIFASVFHRREVCVAHHFAKLATRYMQAGDNAEGKAKKNVESFIDTKIIIK